MTINPDRINRNRRRASFEPLPDGEIVRYYADDDPAAPYQGPLLPGGAVEHYNGSIDAIHAAIQPRNGQMATAVFASPFEPPQAVTGRLIDGPRPVFIIERYHGPVIAIGYTH